ncbi:5'-hydroxyaverantin dehydrogenase [Fulvia fulva]|uniref:5'-hydroxyaverantin dehydrogenase n=1 Tax=Passalora fulva TaxID=5499 RepID=A0A9Q8P5F9_PASFU|nr:5'-hydroxyaverantin dehydrogenase [Fulvia fulva]KAK4630963.1 5'-hydroxyaverantin dehydrogenase [Fulvia fulva]KAK4632600.1 5'-hydroxyaverantin dehydrogenase [Fulvia fulva]UJO13948.1 5'-hydroxyaverantin dehydrogenase [Fulvia fulva]WPV11047.1 5'-hydroxyaverantin dehydrogenase [Fulvia fulva]WPV26268.1 5'-hydroxyaverantin dehydrogenase [Fulvia fulva]
MTISTEFDQSEAIAADATYDPSGLKGKSVIVTGGASGIGEQTMRAFVGAGAFVTFGDIAEELGQKLVQELGDDKVAFVRCNVVTWSDQLELFKTALDKSPSKTIDIVFANAGLNGPDNIFFQDENADEPKEPDLHVLKTNLIGTAYTAKLANLYLPRQPSGEDRDRCLIFTASMAGYMDQAGSPQYDASKWGVRGLLRSIRTTGPAQGVRVNLIAPWFVDTRIMSDEIKQKLRAGGIEFCDIQDAARAVLHFASTKHINGRALTIVPKSVSQRGYVDLQEDDFPEGELITQWQQVGKKLAHRMSKEA